MTTILVGPLPIVLCQTIFPLTADVGRLGFVGCREDLPAGRYAVDGGGNADKGSELHHDFDEFLARNAAAQSTADMGSQLRRRGAEGCQRGDGDDLSRACVKRPALVDFAVDRFEYIGCELRSYVTQGSLDLLRGLPENFTDLLCTASAALRVRLNCASFCRRSR